MSLVEFAYEHHKALDSDLMHKTGHELNDVGRSLSWSALYSFIGTLGADSEVARDIAPDLHEWTTRLKTNMLLADIFDMLAMINANLVAVGSHKKTKQPKPYPRPSDKSKGNTYGNTPVPVADLRKLFAGKRKRHKNV